MNLFDSYDSNLEDGILHATCVQMAKEMKDKMDSLGITCPKEREWAMKGILKWDEMIIKEKIVYDIHTHEIIGFEEGGYDDAML